MKKYMVVENYKNGCFEKIYERYNSKGRLFPEGLHFLNSWVNKDKNTLLSKTGQNWKLKAQFTGISCLQNHFSRIRFLFHLYLTVGCPNPGNSS